MKVLILAGGFGTRISEESFNKPKPMIEIGGKPVLMHLMDVYISQGFNEFVILAGYRQEYIKKYFHDYYISNSDLEIEFGSKHSIRMFNRKPFNAKVTILDTGLNTMTGGRVKRALELFEDEEFLLTYGDGLSNANISELLNVHRGEHRLVTLTSVNPGSRFGTLVEKDNKVVSFREKHSESDGWINGGFMVINRGLLDFLKDDTTILERGPFEKVAQKGLMGSYRHYGFWQCMDTLRDKNYLEELIETKKYPWMDL
mgnify:CR=1 FL=1